MIYKFRIIAFSLVFHFDFIHFLFKNKRIFYSVDNDLNYQKLIALFNRSIFHFFNDSSVKKTTLKFKMNLDNFYFYNSKCL